MRTAQSKQPSQPDEAEGHLVAAVCKRQAKHPTGMADAIRRHGRMARP